jgi:hypothetical protein
MAREFAADARVIKVSGEVENDSEWQHGDVIHFVARAKVYEVAFPEDRHSSVTRVHRVQLIEASAVDAEDVEKLLGLQREKRTGQGDLISELHRSDEDR